MEILQIPNPQKRNELITMEILGTSVKNNIILENEKNKSYEGCKF